ncbi:MAG TPA: hypothetical protein VIR64_09620 [Pseudobacillus sp.]
MEQPYSFTRQQIVLNDEQFLKGMETIYDFPGDFLGEEIEFDGFTFHGENMDKRQPFKSTIPVLLVKDWHSIDKQKDPYDYREY